MNVIEYCLYYGLENHQYSCINNTLDYINLLMYSVVIIRFSVVFQIFLSDHPILSYMQLFNVLLGLYNIFAI